MDDFFKLEVIFSKTTKLNKRRDIAQKQENIAYVTYYKSWINKCCILE